MGIAQASTTASCYHYTLSIFYKVGNQLIGVSITDNCSTRDTQDDVFAFGAMHFLAHACLTCLSFKVVAIAVINEGIQVGGSFDVDAATSAAIAPVGAAKWSKLLTTEVAGAVAAITRFHINFCMVIKHN